MPRVPKSRLTLSGEIREQRRRITDKTTQFSGTGLHFPEPGTVQVEGNLWVTGDFTADGKIDNDALTDPVYPFVGHAQANGFTVLTDANHAVATITVPVPAGYTRAMVTAFAHVSVFNTNAGSDYLYAVAWIQDDTDIGWSMPVTIGPSTSATTSQTSTALLTDLDASFTVKVATSCVNAAMVAGPSGNVANIDATVFFLR